MAQKNINGTTFTARKMTGERAFHNTIWLGKLIGPSLANIDLGAIAEADEAGGKDAAAQAGLAMMSNALAQCNPKDVTAFMKEMLSSVYVTEANGAEVPAVTVLESLDFNEQFQALFLAIQENFANFFDGKQLRKTPDTGKEPVSQRQKFGA